MHIEPGIVTGAKIILSYATAAAVGGVTLKYAFDAIRAQGMPSLVLRSVISTVLVFCFFEVLPHAPVGVSEVHLILGTTLLLLFGAAPAAIGLAMGLLVQGLSFAPFDLPQYGMNVTTLLVPLFAIDALAKRVIPAGTAYVDVTYAQLMKLSFAYQGGVVAWVAFWAFYGLGVSKHTLESVGAFGIAYMAVILIEPLVDLAVLAGAKALKGRDLKGLVTPRLYAAA
ncbi:energy-coupling factor ABC transporter permease [Tabrizicola sp. J26]|uniref:energy-coupling factor ABC transporter permease n=1 Tax=Alitabrizicola rongguiensis TaxID=2909234 RepID=UPI001F4185C7|nr:energy-coupling factor ABC transporter permease [Tabrizicola rongguiensis]MCF1710212.1 energy-coupling factor ABC transporter permease [Tabrizicola rongguiensis]